MSSEKMNNSNSQPVSSAELTGLWRSAYPSISYDGLSQYLVSEEAKKQSNDFIEYHNYPLIERKISARAGYIFSEAVRLIDGYDCDSVISFACGYSMLGLLVAQQVAKNIAVVDTDLSDILQSRQSRLAQLPLNENQQNALKRIHHLVFDIEKACKDNVTLSSFFEKYKRPVVVLEGITYFLQPKTRNWLIEQLKQWPSASVIIEYWPENSLEISQKIKDSFEANLVQDFKEDLKSFMLNGIIADLKHHYDNPIDIGVGQAESRLSEIAGEASQLIDQNEYYPIRIFSGIPKKMIEKN